MQCDILVKDDFRITPRAKKQLKNRWGTKTLKNIAEGLECNGVLRYFKGEAYFVEFHVPPKIPTTMEMSEKPFQSPWDWDSPSDPQLVRNYFERIRVIALASCLAPSVLRQKPKWVQTEAFALKCACSKKQIRKEHVTLGYCAYCYKKGAMTKEHVVPKCVGGTLTIDTCAKCNHERGTSLHYPGFVQWRRKNPILFEKAVKMSRKSKKTKRWLNNYSIYSV